MSLSRPLSRLRAPSVESLFVAAVVLFGLRLGAHAIGDNSMFAHLRTGIDRPRGPATPRKDPNSTTPHAHPWAGRACLAAPTQGWAYRRRDLPRGTPDQAHLTGATR